MGYIQCKVKVQLSHSYMVWFLMALLVDVFGFAGYRWTTKSVEQQGSSEFQLNLALHVEARGTRTDNPRWAHDDRWWTQMRAFSPIIHLLIMCSCILCYQPNKCCRLASINKAMSMWYPNKSKKSTSWILEWDLNPECASNFQARGSMSSKRPLIQHHGAQCYCMASERLALARQWDSRVGDG